MVEQSVFRQFIENPGNSQYHSMKLSLSGETCRLHAIIA